jgi:cyclophilin family peptidyl-prolyl cis-trans isomerase
VAKQYSSAPDLDIDLAASYTAVIHTSAGDIHVDLYASEAPQTVNNFVFLANDGFYDDVIFHRTIKGFMIQGGDPTGTGRGGPGYKFRDELGHAKSSYTRGTLAMANSGPNTNGSQFFIMHADYGLPNQYSIFGEVTAGLDVVDAIAEAPTGAQDRPHDPVSITGIDVTTS